MRFTLANTLIISGALLLSACSSTPLGNKVPIEDRSLTNQNGKDGQNTSGAKAAAIDSRAVETIVAPGSQSKNDMTGIPQKRSIYFDYNSFVIKSDSQTLLEAHAKYLNSKKGQKIIIQGNTDERGGREYNLALGQKRAEAVRKALSLLNVAESQMEAVSFGKEKPKAAGSNEASWAENRRSDIIYQ
ncbi:MAG: peptidoglycan-associated lipoprotein Pal [Burkholderiaceae bacterium]